MKYNCLLRWPTGRAGNIEGAYCFASLHGGICGSELVESDPHVRDGRGARALGSDLHVRSPTKDTVIISFIRFIKK